MDERGSKRARQQRHGVGIVGGLPVGDNYAAYPRTSLAGCHLRVDTSQKHLFIGIPIDVKVSLLNDEDMVQRATQGINVSITGEDGEVAATHPNMFELTPQRPAILDGTSTFQLLLWPGCVRFGNCIKVHVEAASERGGVQIDAYSEPVMVCRSALNVVTQPPENWYKDEGGKNNCIVIEVLAREKSSGQPGGPVVPGVPLNLALVYKNGTEVHSQEILQIQADVQLVTNERGRASLKFKITEVSQRHQSQEFCIRIGPDTRISPECAQVAPVLTNPVMVLSKRKNRRLKAEKAMQQNAAAMANAQQSGLNGLLLASSYGGQLPTPNMNVPPLGGGPQHWSNPAARSMLPSVNPPAGRGGGGGGGRMGSPPPHAQGPADPLPPPAGASPNIAPVSAPVEEKPLRVPPGASGALQKVFRWTDAVLQLLQMELQWEHIGYERGADGAASYSLPLFRCPLCRVCKGSAQPHQKHADDCKLRGLLDEFEGRTAKDFAKAVEEQRGGGPRAGGSSFSSPSPMADPGAGAGGSNAGNAGMERPVSAILGLKSASDGLEEDPGLPGRGAPPPGGHFHPGMSTNNDMLIRGGSGGMSRGSSAGWFNLLDNNNMGHSTSTAEGRGPQRGGGDSSGLPRTGSVAPFVPQRADLTPAEGKAHFIMLPTTTPAADGDGGGGGGGSSSKQLTVFSEKGMLLGFYEEKYDVGQQIHLPFQGFEDHFSPSAKRALETKLQAALEEEAGDRRGVGAGGAKGGVDAMDTDGGSAYYKKRGGPGRPTRSTSAAAAAGSKREVEDAARKDSAAGYRKVYKLADFKGYQEMKEQVFLDWGLDPGQPMNMNVFDSEKTESKPSTKTSLR